MARNWKKKRSLKATEEAVSNFIDDTEDAPPKKRQKLSKEEESKQDDSKSEAAFGKEYNLTKEELNKLPCLMNPSFHKTVFESYRLSRNIKKPIIEIQPSKNGKSFECTIKVLKNNVQGKNKYVSVTCIGRSKKQAEILAFEKLNCKYIDFLVLSKLMEPFSLPNKNCQYSINNLMSKKGISFENKTNCLILQNLPLTCNETDIVKLMIEYDIKNSDKHENDKVSKSNNDKDNSNDNDEKEDDDIKISPWRKYCELVNHISFERENETCITQNAFLQFEDIKETSKYVKLLNDITFKNHKIIADWYGKDMNPKFSNLKNRTSFVYISGWPSEVNEVDIWKYLSDNFEIEPINIALSSRYALCPIANVRFGNHKFALECYNKLIDNNAKYTLSGKHYRLYMRFAKQNEFVNEMDVAKYAAQLTKESNKIDISNVAWNVTEKELLNVFNDGNSSDGSFKIVKCQLFPRKDLNPGNAFVEFESSEMAELAVMQKNGTILKNNAIEIKLHQTQSLEDKKTFRMLHQMKIQQLGKKRQEEKQAKIAQRKKKNRKRKMRKMKMTQRMGTRSRK